MSNKLGFNKIIHATCALDIATFNLFLLKKKSLCLGKLSTSDVVVLLDDKGTEMSSKIIQKVGARLD